ncbi:MAG: sugar ABC transporter permease [Ruminococcaceae bacterium]|nr:sugar ABC transporter permease [Oscillospiraceae bacterium]
MKSGKRKKGTAAFIAACLFPSLILLSLFVIYPTLSIFRVSLYKWGGYSAEKIFTGFENYKILFRDGRFFDSLRNSFLLIIVVTAVTLVLSLFTAEVLSREKLFGKTFFRIVFYIPNILSTVVIAAVFSAIYDPSRGLLNSVISLFSPGTRILWLGDRSLVIYSVAIAMIWQAVGYYMVMYMSSMAQIPESLYEAASLEGAGRLRSFFSVTLPGIAPTLRTTLTFFIISNINISFLLVRAMTGGGPDGGSEVLLSYMYKQAYTNSSYGYGMAIGTVVFLFSFALAAAVNLATRTKD